MLPSPVLLVVLLSASPARGSEVDTYSGHPEVLRDGRVPVNAIMNRALALGVRRANRHPPRDGACDAPRLYRKLLRQFVGGPGGFLVSSRVERRLVHDRTLDQIKTRLKDSIYRRFGTRKLPTMVGGGLASLFAFDDHLIGTDKFGHFVAFGWEYFVRVEREELPVRDALELGFKQEAGMFGAATTGVFSYADLSANYNGLLFWQRMIGTSDDLTAFVACVPDTRRWRVQNEIDMDDYIDATWDERVNPSDYVDPELAKKSNAQVEEVYATNPAYPIPKLSLLEDVQPATNPKYKDLPRELAPIAPSLIYP